MTSYVVLLPGNEASWANATEEQKQVMYGHHREFARLLDERGHKQIGGAELAPSADARVLRTDAKGEQTVTQGPYAETAEQLSGFYVIESDDLDDLVECCRVLARGESAIEIRRCVEH